MKVRKTVLSLVRTAAGPMKGGGMLCGICSKLTAIAAFLLFVAGAGAQAPAAWRGAVGPGCDPARQAIAYHAASFMGGKVPSSHHGDLPIPCAVVTGSTTETATVGVSRDGTLFYAPQSTGVAVAPGLYSSHNEGATWNVLTPTLQPGTTSGIPWMHVDRQTNRIWFAPTGPVPATCTAVLALPAADHTLAQVAWSDDEGRTWHSPVGDPAACRQLQGGMSIVEGPAPRGQPQPVGYPHVVYHCGNVSDGAIPWSVHCWKSLDGGQSWSFVQGPNDPPSNCKMQNGRYGGRGRAVGPDGTLYMSVECLPTAGGQGLAAIAGPGPLYLASSSDEGNTWQYQFVTNTSYELNEAMVVGSLAVDQAGNLYIAWVDENNNPMLVVGKASRWGTPLNVAQPNVNYVSKVAVAVNSPGHVAIAYIGSTGGIDGTFNGYITESWDALDENPTFIGAPVNDPKTPLMSSAYAESAISASQGRIWFLTDAFGPDGTPWAAFHCANMTNGTTTGIPAASITCPDGAAPPAAPLALGVVGRLASDHGNH
jgi:hypothetical protein